MFRQAISSVSLQRIAKLGFVSSTKKSLSLLSSPVSIKGFVSKFYTMPRTEIDHPILEANSRNPFGKLTPDQFYTHHSVTHGSDYFTSSKTNLKLFTQWWTPQNITHNVKGVVCMVHGYTGESSWLIMQLTAVYIAKHGFVVCAIDHMGHGLSEGKAICVQDFDVLVQDCLSFFNDFRGRYPGVRSFLYGESLGGAIGMLVTLRKELEMRFDGMLLNGAICVVDEGKKLPWEIQDFLTVKSIQVEWKRELALACPRRPLVKPDEATSKELLRMCREVRLRLKDINTPFMFLHGGADRISPYNLMMEVYEEVGTKISEGYFVSAGGWHQLVGEVDLLTDFVFHEVSRYFLWKAGGGVSNAAAASGF